MSLFKRKPIYRHKMFERFRVNIAKLLEAHDGSETEYCQLIGDTDKYHLYEYKPNKSDYQGYLLRQEKKRPGKVVYLGRANNKSCLFHDKLYMIDRISRVGQTYHPLFCMDIENGTKVEYDVLSHKECFIAGASFHIHCQDFVESICVEDGLMLMHVSRYEEKTNYEKELEYDIQFIYVNGKILPQYFFPEEADE